MFIANTAEMPKFVYLISPSGSYKQIKFEFGTGTQVQFSCSLQWKNHFYVFGGRSEPKQVSMLSGNKLERKADLKYPLYLGGCTVMNQLTVVLCFDMYTNDLCRHSNNPLDGNSFTDLPKSNYTHSWTRVTSVDGKNEILFKKLNYYTLDTIIAVGSSRYGVPGKGTPLEKSHNHVELFTWTSKKWQTKKDYPFGKDIYLHRMVVVDKKPIIMGGFCLHKKVLKNKE